MRTLVFTIFIIISTLCLTYSCGSDADVLPNQISSIVKYLDNKGVEYVNVEGVYKSIINGDRYGRDELVDSKSGDSISFNFEAYTFGSSPSSQWFYTNKKSLVDAVDGINTQYWDLTPRRVKVGSGGLIKGIEYGLPNCRVGDSIHLYITSDLAYGDHSAQGVGGNSAILYILNIIDLK